MKAAGGGAADFAVRCWKRSAEQSVDMDVLMDKRFDVFLI